MFLPSVEKDSGNLPLVATPEVSRSTSDKSRETRMAPIRKSARLARKRAHNTEYSGAFGLSPRAAIIALLPGHSPEIDEVEAATIVRDFYVQLKPVLSPRATKDDDGLAKDTTTSPRTIVEEKPLRVTNWTARPLSHKHCQVALPIAMARRSIARNFERSLGQQGRWGIFVCDIKRPGPVPSRKREYFSQRNTSDYVRALNSSSTPVRFAPMTSIAHGDLRVKAAPTDKPAIEYLHGRLTV